MFKTLDVLPPAPEVYGYSVQSWLAVWLSGELFDPNRRYAWFSTTFNAVVNVPSSNPCIVYAELSEAVQRGDAGHRQILYYQSLLLTLLRNQVRFGNPVLSNRRIYQTYLKRIDTASISDYRAEVWRLDLKKIAQRRTNGDLRLLMTDLKTLADARAVQRPQQQPQPDEYFIDDLHPDEFEVIIVG